MDAFNKLTSMLLNALETREPTVDLLQSFVDHWKAITNYYIETTDDSRPVKQTEIPWRLKQMLDILIYEEKTQEDNGVCLDYLLEHKLLETLCTLGKAQYPPGMIQQVLIFFSKFLSEMKKSLLSITTVYRPVLKLIGLCALPGSQTEREAAQFLLVVCSRVTQEPHTLTHILEIVDKPTAAASSQSESSKQSAEPSDQSQSSLLPALLKLTQSTKHAVRMKAYQSLLLLSSHSSSGSSGSSGCWAQTLSERTQLSELVSGHLSALYSLVPLEGLEPTEIQGWSHTAWSSSSSSSDEISAFFSWFDFLDHMMTEAPQVLAERLAQCVHQFWLVEKIQPQLMNRCEQLVLSSTSVLCAVVRLTRSAAMLDRLVHFLFRTPSTTLLILGNCDHISDQISMASLSLVDECLRMEHRDILECLVLSFLLDRAYLAVTMTTHTATGQQQQQQEDTHTESEEEGEEGDGLEEDPFFSDQLIVTRPPTDQSADTVNSFLCLVPVQVRSAHLLQEGGYESYVHDAHTLVTECAALSERWDWPVSLPAPSSSSTASNQAALGGLSSSSTASNQAASEGLSSSSTVSNQAALEGLSSSSTASNQAALEGVSSSSTASNQAALEGVSSSSTASNQAALEGLSSSSTASNQAALEGVSSSSTASNQAALEGLSSSSTASNQAALEGLSSSSTASNQAALEGLSSSSTASNQAALEGVSSSSTASNQAALEGLSSSSTASNQAALEGVSSSSTASNQAALEGLSSSSTASNQAALEGLSSSSTASNQAASEGVSSSTASNQAASEGVSSSTASNQAALEGLSSSSTASNQAALEGVSSSSTASNQAALEGLSSSVVVKKVFNEGPLLKVLFDRLARVLEQPYELNLRLTAILSRLASFSHPLLHEFLLNPYICLSVCTRSLFSVLVRLMGELMQRSERVCNLTDRLIQTRRDLLGQETRPGLQHVTLLRGVIVLEEFCKELAAIAFVKMPMDTQ